MIAKDHEALRNELDDFSHRIEAKSQEFTARGEFSETHRAVAEKLQQRQHRIRDKLEAAISAGQTWDVVRDELERDFSSLQDDFVAFQERLDTETMRAAGNGRPKPA